MLRVHRRYIHSNGESKELDAVVRENEQVGARAIMMYDGGEGETFVKAELQ